MKIDEHGNPVPGPTSILPAAALAASYGSNYDDDDEDDLEGDIALQNETENF
jgi:DNA-directed RNA polymerase subunit alpha